MSIASLFLLAASATTTAASTATTVPAEPRASDSLVPALGLLAFGLIGAAIARVFRAGSIEGPIRVGRATSAIPLLLITVIGGSVWLGTQFVHVGIKASEFQRKHPGQTFDMSDVLNANDYAFLSVVPAAIGLAVLLLGDFPARLPSRIGYAAAQLPRGILLGVLAVFIALPLVWSSTVFLSIVYEVFNVRHPSEHELLKEMKQAAPVVKWIMVVGACIAAPVFEEMLFRGHMQTLLVRLLMPRVRPAFAPMAQMAEPGDGVLEALPVPEPMEEDPPRAPRWMAVLLTSFLFAIVHPLWMAPAIFVLSVCLGYVYERTGNLWVPILIHAAFNSSSTLVFLNPP